MNSRSQHQTLCVADGKQTEPQPENSTRLEIKVQRVPSEPCSHRPANPVSAVNAAQNVTESNLLKTPKQVV